MKKITLSLTALMAMGTMAFAGGDITPVEPVVDVPVVVEPSNGGFYLGAGYGWTGFEGTTTYTDGTAQEAWDENYGSIMVDAGYKFNDYVAVEGRYWFGLSASNDLGWTSGAQDATVDSWGVYVKPMYPVSSAFDVYALLGYAGSTVTFDDAGLPDVDADGFSWGLGASYSINDNVSIFADYTSIIKDEETSFAGIAIPAEMSVDNINFGVNYQF